MNLRLLADALGIETYPAGMDAVPQALREAYMYIRDPHWVEEMEEQFGVCGIYLEDVKRGAEDLCRDEKRLAWGAAAAAYFTDCSVEEARAIPFPKTDATPAGDMLPFLVLLTQVKTAAQRYERLGIQGQALRTLLGAYVSSLSSVKNRTSRPGIDKMYYQWTCLYAKTMIFRHGGFNFEFRSFPNRAVILKNRTDGTVVPVMFSGSFHKNGLVLGSAGCEDTTDSFDADFLETEDCFYGHPTRNGKASPERVCFPKTVWECVLRPGDPVLSVHIPKKTDLSPEAIARDFSQGLALARRYVPDRAPKCLFCSSWLLDPGLEDILGPEAKIPAFGRMFTRYPVKSPGDHVFSFVFPPSCKSLEELPENTRLERGLKHLYLSGGYNYAFAGVIIPG